MRGEVKLLLLPLLKMLILKLANSHEQAACYAAGRLIHNFF